MHNYEINRPKLTTRKPTKLKLKIMAPEIEQNEGRQTCMLLSTTGSRTQTDTFIRIFHKLSTTQERQYCHLRFSCAIGN